MRLWKYVVILLQCFHSRTVVILINRKLNVCQLTTRILMTTLRRPVSQALLCQKNDASASASPSTAIAMIMNRRRSENSPSFSAIDRFLRPSLVLFFFCFHFWQRHYLSALCDIQCLWKNTSGTGHGYPWPTSRNRGHQIFLADILSLWPTSRIWCLVSVVIIKSLASP